MIELKENRNVNQDLVIVLLKKNWCSTLSQLPILSEFQFLHLDNEVIL